MLRDILINALQQRFPNRGLRIGENCAVFPAIHPEVGDITVYDYCGGGELIVHIGHFTHDHFANYDQEISAEEAELRIATDVADFLESVFADRIVFWGSHKGGGGWYGIDDASEYARGPRYVWSGPLKREA